MVVSDLTFSGVRSTIKGRSACFANVIYHLVSWIQSRDLASSPDNVTGTVLSLTGLLPIYTGQRKISRPFCYS